MPAPHPSPRHGAHPQADGRVAFGLWAPHADDVDLVLRDEHHAMRPADDGWWQLTAEAAHGDRYAFALDGTDPLPDPAARWLPDGVHAPAAVLDPARFAWTDAGFAAVPITSAVIYELHVGTFTPEGTFAAATEHLADLVDLGVTHVEVMPVNAIDGDRGWGYDGVAWWATYQPYGGPEAFAAFVDACHAAGLAVILDVVFNHLGPSGNYLDRFGPYLNRGGRSTWGELVNLDGAGSDHVRRFIVDCALAWLRDLHVDALRLDAVHALHDASATHVLAELADAVADLSEQIGRPLQLIAESDRNDPATITPRAAGGLGLDAQWADDLHHAIHVAVTGESDGWYVDFADALGSLAAAYTGGFVYDGSRHSAFRDRVVGAPIPAHISSRRLIAVIQNHDQIGNRAAGDRLTTLVEPDLVRVAIALLCAAPQTPMLFMGEEWGETAPFQFFSDMPGEELREAIRTGRREEFAGFTAWQGEVPDPLDVATFERSKLDRAAAASDAGQQRRALWRDLLALRRSQPALATGRRDLVSVLHADGDLFVVRRDPPRPHDGSRSVVLAVNLGAQPIADRALLGPVADVDLVTGADAGAMLTARPQADPDAGTPPSSAVGGAALLLSTADPRYGGDGPDPEASPDILPARTAVLLSTPLAG